MSLSRVDAALLLVSAGLAFFGPGAALMLYMGTLTLVPMTVSLAVVSMMFVSPALGALVAAGAFVRVLVLRGGVQRGALALVWALLLAGWTAGLWAFLIAVSWAE